MEDYLEFKDYLFFRNDKEIKPIINDETLLFSDKVNKTIALVLTKERNIIITNIAFYNLDSKSKLYSYIHNNYI
jgi:hypothetical protein